MQRLFIFFVLGDLSLKQFDDNSRIYISKLTYIQNSGCYK